MAGVVGNFVPEPRLRFLKNFGTKDIGCVISGLGLSAEFFLYLDKKLVGAGIISVFWWMILLLGVGETGELK